MGVFCAAVHIDSFRRELPAVESSLVPHFCRPIRLTDLLGKLCYLEKLVVVVIICASDGAIRPLVVASCFIRTRKK